MECMEAIKREEVDLINLDAGLAYIAFTNYSMKAIMAEEYCYHRRSYEAVAVVNKVSCHENPRLTLEDFRGRRSCHSGYRTAAGWNLPVLYFVKNGLQALPLATDEQTDEEVVHNFFSEACAPSEFPGHGLCDSCGNNGSCDASVDKYRGYSGAFRCLVEGLGDIAFLRSDTVSRLSTNGISAQNWSTKSVDEFMYLCPDQGCKPISDNVGDCKFASVPANVIMTFNSQSNTKKNAIVKALLNANWSDFLYSGKNPQDHILSGSTQGLAELQELTRSFLGGSARAAEAMDSLQNINISVVPTSDGCYRLSRFLNSPLISCIVMIISLFSVFL
ncbi:hypothetical protein KP509_07G072700 [Ceratopteris richardii]|nr:hypothetical protein KP509_07G072700 [Ceratopteris richardii]